MSEELKTLDEKLKESEAQKRIYSQEITKYDRYVKLMEKLEVPRSTSIDTTKEDPEDVTRSIRRKVEEVLARDESVSASQREELRRLNQDKQDLIQAAKQKQATMAMVESMVDKIEKLRKRRKEEIQIALDRLDKLRDRLDEAAPVPRIQ